MSSIFKNKLGIVASCWLALTIVSVAVGGYTYYHAEAFEKGTPTYNESDPFDVSQNPLFTDIKEQPKQTVNPTTQTVAKTGSAQSNTSLLVPAIKTDESDDHSHEGHNHTQMESGVADLTQEPPYGLTDEELSKYHVSPSDSEYVPQSFNKDQDTFFIDARTGEYNSKDSYLNYIHKAISKEEALSKLHITNDKKIKSIDSIKLDIDFRGDALRLTKQSVAAHYNSIIGNESDNIKLKYDDHANIIYVIMKDTFVGNKNSMTKIMGNLKSYRIYNENDPYLLKNYEIITYEGRDILNVIPSAGYNGNLQIIVNDIPYVVVFDPSIEPLFAGNDLSKYVDMVSNYVLEVENPHYNLGSNQVYDNSYLKPTINRDDDYSSNFWGDVDFQSNTVQQPVQEVQTNADAKLNEIKGRLEEQKEKNMDIPTSLWGTKVKDPKKLKDNISDGSDIKAFEGIKLDIVDIEGNQKDMVKETINTKPAGIRTTQVIQVQTEVQEEGIPVITYFCILAAILSFIIYIYYLRLFIESYKRDLEIKGLDGISDTLDTMNFKKIDADSILLDGEGSLTNNEKDVLKRLKHD